MDISEINAFLTVVRAGSISRAAREMQLAQSTVSKRLQTLEESLGVTLIERGKGNRSLYLTEEGEHFVDTAERYETLQRETELLTLTAKEYSLAIGSLDSLNFALFPPVYHSLTEHTPRVTLRILTANSMDLYALMEARQLDVAFPVILREHPLLEVEKYYEDPIIGLCMHNSVHAGKNNIDPRDLNPDLELYVDWGQGYEFWHDKWWGRKSRRRITLDTAQLIFSLLCKEDQWAAVPMTVARAVIRLGMYDTFSFVEAPPPRICYKVTHKRQKARTMSALKLFDNYFTTIQENPPKTLFSHKGELNFTPKLGVELFDRQPNAAGNVLQRKRTII